MKVLPLRARLLLALLAAGCGGGDPPADAVPEGPSPREGPGPGAALAAEDSSDPPTVRDDGAARRPPLPRRPAGPEDRLRGLLRLLEGSGDLDLVRFAQEETASFPDPAAAAAAIREAGTRALRTNPLLVVNLLGAVRTPETGRHLEEFLLACMGSGDPQVKRLSVGAYAATVPEADPAKVAALAADGWSPVALAALDALERLGRSAGAGEAARALLAVLPRVDRFAKPAALATLGRLGDPAAVEALAAGLREAEFMGDPGTSQRLGAAQGLAALGDPRGLETLRTWVFALPLSHPPLPLDDPQEAWSSPERSLARARDPRLKERLVRQAMEAEGDAAGGAVRLLAEYPEDEATGKAVAACLGAGEWRPVLEGLTALRDLGRPDAVRRALEALESAEAHRRYAAALALARFGDRSAVGPLAGRLRREEDEGVARKIADALGILGDPAAAPALVAFLRSDAAASPDTALRAFTARHNLRGSLAAAAAPALLEAIREGLPGAQLAHAARALGQGPPAAATRTALEDLLSHADPRMREQAALALGDLGDRSARDALAGRYAREPDDGVADALRSAILRIDLGGR